jgi:hypothetical protein
MAIERFNISLPPVRDDNAGYSYSVFFKIVGTVYPNFVKRPLFVRFLYFPFQGLVIQTLPARNS